MEKVLRRFSTAFKQAVVADVRSGQYTVLEASRIHEIHFAIIYRWMKHYGGPGSQTRIVRIEMPDERNRILKLEQEKQALEKALAQAQLKIMTLEATLEVLEERTGQRIKKKTDTPLSNDSGNDRPT
ncbi:MAG: transposase [Ignavibacteriales bacterium]|nr:transposase [Ignavibacteriales bacterium]